MKLEYIKVTLALPIITANYLMLSNNIVAYDKNIK